MATHTSSRHLGRIRVSLLSGALGALALFWLDLSPSCAQTSTGGTGLSRQERIEEKRQKLREMVTARKRQLAEEAARKQSTTAAGGSATTVVPAPSAPKPSSVQPPGAPRPPISTRGAPKPGAPQPPPPKPGTPQPGPKTTKGRGANSAPTIKSPDLVIMLRPYHQSVRSGQRFLTEVALYSEESQLFDRVRIAIAYSRHEVRPLQVFDFPLEDALDPARPAKTEIVPGLLIYEAYFSGPRESLGTKPLVNVIWEALIDTPRSDLILNWAELPEDRESGIFRDDANLLDAKSTQGNACINARIAIGDTDSMGEPRDLTVWRKGRLASAGGDGGTVRLDLRRSEKQPAAADEFVLDVMLENPDFLAFDEVRLAIQFDPAKAVVLDWDYNNWIRRGVNVFDGHAHELFPFNVHTHNDVRNPRGRIRYQMGNSSLATRPSGCLLRIHARVKAPGALESFTLFPQNQTHLWFTDVRAGTRSVLAPPASEGGPRPLLASGVR